MVSAALGFREAAFPSACSSALGGWGVVGRTRDMRSERWKIDVGSLALKFSQDLIFVHPFVAPGGGRSRFIEVSDSASELLGYSRDELLAMGPVDLLTSRDAADVADEAAELRANGTATFQKAVVTKDGRELVLELKARVFEHDGDPIVFSTARDVTEQTRVAKELARSEARYRTIVETAYEGIWQIDAEGRTTFVNPRLTEMLGYSSEEMLGRSFFDFMDGNARLDAESYFDNRRAGVAEQHEFRFRHRDGRDVWTLVSAAPVLSGDEFLGALAMVTDITTRRVAELERERSERRYHELIECLPDAVFVLDREWRHLLVNEAATVYSGTRRDELIGNRLIDVFPGIEETAFFRLFASVMETGNAGHMIDEYVFEDGRTGWYEMRTFPVPEGILCISRDISKQVTSERALQDSQEKLAGILDNIQDVVWSMSWPDLEVLYVTPSIEALYGRPQETFLASPDLWRHVTHPDDRESVEAALQELETKGVAERKFRVVHPDGRVVWVLDKSHLVYNDDGTPVRVDGVASDISELQVLRGLLPICASCKRIRDDQGYWHEVEDYLSRASDLLFSHGICQECVQVLYPEYFDR
jgi:PAS domain S-box-containing protein